MPVEENVLLTNLELRRIELRASRMQSEHSTTELQPHDVFGTPRFTAKVTTSPTMQHYESALPTIKITF